MGCVVDINVKNTFRKLHDTMDIHVHDGYGKALAIVARCVDSFTTFFEGHLASY